MTVWSVHKNTPVRRDEVFSPFSRDLTRLFDSFFAGTDMGRWRNLEEGAGAYSPRVDVTEDDKAFRVIAELPGLDEKDVEVLLSKDTLTLKGEKKSEREEKEGNYYRMERTFGSFHRTIPLPSEIQMEKVEAAFKKGVLTVTLPKTAEAQKEVRKISVKKE